MAKLKRHPTQTVCLAGYPDLLQHEFHEGDVVVVRAEGGWRMGVLKDVIRKTRKLFGRCDELKGLYERGRRFPERTKKEILREYRLITEHTGVVIGRSPKFGLPVHGIANVGYLVGGNGFSGLSYEYDVCFMMVEYDERRKIHRKVCMVWTLWRGAIRHANHLECE
jgi:hypothetical protein